MRKKLIGLMVAMVLVAVAAQGIIGGGQCPGNQFACGQRAQAVLQSCLASHPVACSPFRFWDCICDINYQEALELCQTINGCY